MVDKRWIPGNKLPQIALLHMVKQVQGRKVAGKAHFSAASRAQRMNRPSASFIMFCMSWGSSTAQELWNPAETCRQIPNDKHLSARSLSAHLQPRSCALFNSLTAAGTPHRFVDSSDAFPPVVTRILESELRHPHAGSPCDNLCRCRDDQLRPTRPPH